MDESTARPITSLDVARLAGVSQSTVSLVLNGKANGRASAGVQERVRCAATQLHYRPHPSASALRSGLTRTVGLFVPDVTNPFLGRVLRGAQRAANDAGYTVVLVEPGDDEAFKLSAVEALSNRGIDGLLFFAVKPPPQLQRAAIPVVLIEAERRGAPSVTLDVTGGARVAVEHLLALGHRRIAHLAADLPMRTFALRSRAWAEALSRQGVPARDQLEQACSFTLDGARAAAVDLLSRSRRPTAVFCDDDLLAAGARLAAEDLSLDVPGALSLVGFAGTILSECVSPQLTTVRAPAETLGGTAIEVLLARLAGQPFKTRTVLPVELEVRGSSARPGEVAP